MSEYNVNNQIARMYRDGMSIEEISDGLGLSVEAVTMVLAQREKRELGDRYNYVVDKLSNFKDLAIDTLVEVMKNSMSDNVRVECAKTVLDYVTGNKEPKKLGADISAFDINAAIKEAQMAYARAIGSRLGRIKVDSVIENSDSIDIKSDEKQQV